MMTGHAWPQDEEAEQARVELLDRLDSLERRIAELEAWLEEMSGDLLDRTA